MSNEIDALLQETAVFRRPTTSGATPTRTMNRSTTSPTARRIGRRGRSSSTGRRSGTRCWSGSAPYAKWFVGGKLNASANCLDRHLATRGDKQALIWEGEPGDVRTFTYRELHAEVSKFANVLKSLGVDLGDRVAIYMPLVPEAVVAMLACARIGAAHSVVFGGFSSEALRDRIQDAEAKVLITADGRISPRQSRPAQETRRRRRGRLPVDRARRRRDAPRGRGGVGRHRHDEARPRLLVPRADARRARPTASRSGSTPSRCSTSLYTSRHDRQAEGNRAHDRRLSHRLRTPRANGSSI